MAGSEINRDVVEEIKNRLDIVDVIGETVTLTHRSGSEYTGSVGIKGHSGASLKVDRNKQVYNDMKNGEGGDVFDWIGYTAGLDARGADFPEVLRIAAEKAGVALPDTTPEEMEKARERTEVQDLLTEAAGIYHKNLKQEHYDFIKEKWGITPETVNSLKIGYATPGQDLEDLDIRTLKKSGLVYVNNGMIGGEVFRGRLIFPYWKGGKVVYFIGRETEETPQNEKDKGMKYRKQPVHKEKYPYISETVQNSHFYGEDSLRGADYCILTEGVTDCISMMQAGLPCISPVTVQFREKDHPKLLELTRKLKTVYICNDNEENEAGLKGALKTAGVLEGAGIETRLIELPRPEGLDKIDIADYMKDHSPEDFRGLMGEAVGLWDFKLSRQAVPDKTLQRKKAAELFILEELNGMDPDDLKTFVMEDVRGHFGLKAGDVRQAMKKAQAAAVEASEEEKTEPVNFEEIARELLKQYKMFVMEDTRDFYVYEGGRYYSEGVESELRRAIREISKGMNVSRGIVDPDPITDREIREVLEYLRDYKFITRAQVNDRPNIINFKNGSLDVDTWAFSEHDPEYFCTIQIPVNYEPEATCPAFDKFISEVVGKEDRAALFEFMGYSLIPDTRIQKAVMLIGKGSNGKSVFLRVLSRLLGGENVSGESMQTLENNRFSVARLYGKLVNVFKDLPTTTLEKCEIFKTLTGDDGEIRGEEKHKQAFYFKNTARLIFSANGLPKVLDDNFAFYRRWILINFPNVIAEEDQDKNLYQKLTTEAELSGILNLALKGLKSVLKNEKFSYSKTASEVERLYKINSRPVDAFVYERLLASADDTPKAYVYGAYVDWCNMNDVKPEHENRFAKIMKRLGYETTRRMINKQKISFYEGVTLKPLSSADRVDDCQEDRETGKVDRRTGSGQGKKSSLSSVIPSTDNEKNEEDRQTGKKPKSSVYTEKKENEIGDEKYIFSHKEDVVKKNTLPVLSAENDNGQAKKSGQANLIPCPVPVRSNNPLSTQNKPLSTTALLRMDLTNFAKQHYNSVVEDLDSFTADYISRNPETLTVHSRRGIREMSGMLKNRGWK